MVAAGPRMMAAPMAVAQAWWEGPTPGARRDAPPMPPVVQQAVASARRDPSALLPRAAADGAIAPRAADTPPPPMPATVAAAVSAARDARRAAGLVEPTPGVSGGAAQAPGGARPPPPMPAAVADALAARGPKLSPPATSAMCARARGGGARAAARRRGADRRDEKERRRRRRRRCGGRRAHELGARAGRAQCGCPRAAGGAGDRAAGWHRVAGAMDGASASDGVRGRPRRVHRRAPVSALAELRAAIATLDATTTAPLYSAPLTPTAAAPPPLERSRDGASVGARAPQRAGRGRRRVRRGGRGARAGEAHPRRRVSRSAPERRAWRDSPACARRARSALLNIHLLASFDIVLY